MACCYQQTVCKTNQNEINNKKTTEEIPWGYKKSSSNHNSWVGLYKKSSKQKLNDHSAIPTNMEMFRGVYL